MEEEKLNDGEVQIQSKPADKSPSDFEENINESDSTNPFQTPSKSTSDEIDEENKLVNKSSDFSAIGNKLRKNDKVIVTNKPNESMSTIKTDKKGKANAFLKTDDKSEEILKKAKEKKLGLVNKKSSEKNNTSNNSDIKSDSDGRISIQNKVVNKKERPLYSNTINSNNTTKNDINKGYTKRPIMNKLGIDYKNHSNCSNNVSTDKNINPLSCLSTAANSNTDINSPDNHNNAISMEIQIVEGNSNSKESNECNLIEKINIEDNNAFASNEDIKENLNLNENNILSSNKDEEELESNDFNQEKEISDQTDIINDINSEGIEKNNLLEKTPSQSNKLNTGNININTEINLEENVEVSEEKPAELEKDTIEENSVKPESSTTIYLKNLMLIEEKMFNILENLRNNKQPTNACFEFWNFYFFCLVGESYESFFKEEAAKKVIKESNLLELISIMVCYDASYDIKVMNIVINNLKNLIYLVHQNFLIICDFLLTKLPLEMNNVFTHKIQNLILTKLAKRIKKGENVSALKQNSDNLITSIKAIFRIYSGKKELIEILSSYIKNLQKINMNNLNELFRTKIYKVPQIKKAQKIPLYVRGIHNKEVVEKQVEIPAPYIKDPSEKKYTLVLDLDETLIHFKVDSQDESKGILRIRPGLFEFLNLMKEYYELIIFTAATQDYADPIIDAIERDEQIFKYKLYRQHVTIRDDEYLKDLSKIGRELENMIIVDNMPQNFNLQRENGIFIKSFYGDDNDDTALVDLAPILIAIVKEFPEDIREELAKYRDEILNKISSNIGKLND